MSKFFTERFNSLDEFLEYHRSYIDKEVMYFHFIGHLGHEIYEQKKENAELRERIEKLESRLDANNLK